MSGGGGLANPSTGGFPHLSAGGAATGAGGIINPGGGGFTNPGAGGILIGAGGGGFAANGGTVPSFAGSSPGGAGNTPGTGGIAGTGGSANSVCGDGSCNGGETQSSCCADCGCPSGSSCSNGSCVAQPRCGDGSCNGAETQNSCCADCGCPSGSSCSGGTCQCTEGSVTFTSALHDAAGYCVNLNQSYTQQAAAYLVLGGTTYYIPDGGYVTDTENIGTSLSGTFQCCYLDGCVGNSSCNTPFGAEPCICLNAQSWSTTVNQCSSSFVICQ